MKSILSLALALLTLAAWSESASRWIPDAGLVANLGGGTKGTTVTGGVTAYFPSISTNIQIEAAADEAELTADWLYWSGSLGGIARLKWTAGPGVYIAGGRGDGTTAFAMGLRGVGGIEYRLADRWLAFAYAVPAVGLNRSRSDMSLMANGDVEIGVRYRFASPQSPAPAAVVAVAATVVEPAPVPAVVPVATAPVVAPAVVVLPPKITATLPDAFVFTPDGDGENDRAVLTVTVVATSDIASWTFDVTDPAGHAFYHTSGNGAVPATLIWDGKSTTGELAQSAQKYGYHFVVTDSAGTSGEAAGSIATGFLMIQTSDGFKIDLSNLTFVPNKAQLIEGASDAARTNADVLARLTQVLKEHSGFSVAIVGHAINVSKTRAEEAEVQALSKARAETLKRFLATHGFTGSAVTRGVGSTQPLFPDSDRDNAWKNRRVEILLIKEGANQ